MNTLKLKIVVLCFLFLGLGYAIANYQHIKDKLCEVKQTQNTTLEEEGSNAPDTTLNATSGLPRYSGQP
ncbi:MAG: hypothetical protein JWQ09_2486 [Segetibacter sp.]|nr:hypothetical protein [Segetibacter sp.]